MTENSESGKKKRRSSAGRKESWEAIRRESTLGQGVDHSSNVVDQNLSVYVQKLREDKNKPLADALMSSHWRMVQEGKMTEKNAVFQEIGNRLSSISMQKTEQGVTINGTESQLDEFLFIAREWLKNIGATDEEIDVWLAEENKGRMISELRTIFRDRH